MNSQDSRKSCVLFVIFLVFVFFYTLPAAENDIHFGLLAGGNGSSNYGIETSLKGIKYDFGTGLFLSKNFSDGNGIRFEVLFESKGNMEKFKSSDAFKNVTSKHILYLHYLEINILGQLAVDVYELPLEKLYFGLSPAFLIRSYTVNKTGDEIEKNDVEGLRNLDLGIILGTCYSFNDHWKIHARVNAGMLNVPDSQAADLRNITISALIEYQF